MMSVLSHSPAVMHALVDTSLDADDHRQVPGMQVTRSEDGAGWLAFFRDPARRGLTQPQ